MAKVRILKTIQKNIPFVNLSTSFIYLALIFVLSIVAFFFFNKSVENLGNFGSFGNDVSRLQNDKSEKKIVYFYMEGCGHCKEFAPTWDKFIKTSPIPTYKIESKGSDSMLQKYNISGFPTIVLLDSKNELIKTLNGERTLEGLNAFIK